MFLIFGFTLPDKNTLLIAYFEQKSTLPTNVKNHVSKVPNKHAAHNYHFFLEFSINFVLYK